MEAFIAEGRVRSFPTLPADLADENSVLDLPSEPALALRVHVERAYARARRVPSVLASTLASWLLTQHDDAYGVDLVGLPSSAATPDRILAHLESMDLHLEPALAASIARRTSLVLLARRASEAVPVSLGAPPVSDGCVDEMCFACGSTLTHGACARCASPTEPAPAHAPPVAKEPPPAVKNVRGEGRVTIAYVRATEDIVLSGGIQISKGEILERVSPNDRDRADLERDRANGRPMVVVWWSGMARLLDSRSVTLASAEEIKEPERC